MSDQLVSVVHLFLSSVLPLHQVSLKLRVFEKNQNLLLAPEYSALKPASYVILRLRGPSQQCFLVTRNLSVSVIGCRTTT